MDNRPPIALPVPDVRLELPPAVPGWRRLLFGSSRFGWASRLALLLFTVLLFSGYLWLPKHPRDFGLMKVRVEPGQGVRQIGQALESAGVIRSGYGFWSCAIVLGAQADLKAGLYQVSPSWTPCRIVTLIAEGRAEPEDVRVFVPEGVNIWETEDWLGEILPQVRGQFARAYYQDEGRLFPDSYQFAPTASSSEVARVMRATFDARVGTIDDRTLIIASMLEKEARTPEDMALVAGIIEKRLSLGMLLQIDATVAYGWCYRLWQARGLQGTCDVTQAPIATELRIEGPYNTYRIKGLPPRPIANPGVVAIEAARHPTPSDYLYYLSTRDGSQIIYSKTGAEHNRNRAKYLGL